MAKRTAQARRTPGSYKVIPSKVTVSRTTEGGTMAFVACAYIGTRRAGNKQEREGGMRRTGGDECAWASNPRAATAKALTKLGRSLKDRQEGAFRGLKRKSRKARR